jgi:hypothetical protein
MFAFNFYLMVRKVNIPLTRKENRHLTLQVHDQFS